MLEHEKEWLAKDTNVLNLYGEKSSEIKNQEFFQENLNRKREPTVYITYHITQ